MSFAQRFTDEVGTHDTERGNARQVIISRIEDLLASEYDTDHRARLNVASTYKLYVDLCTELGQQPEIVYTGEGVTTEEELEAMAQETGQSKEEIINKLEVTV